MTMHENDLKLDGNAAAGLLTEVFAFEATTTQVRCAGCGHEDPVGAAMVYANAPGVVMRCRGCSAVLMRFAEIRDRVVVDMRGAATLTLYTRDSAETTTS
jgi:ribosomal protein S27E